ncbi:sensor histidine kinase [Streptococcus caprae]|uniref:histidine kinase n=1 Tax=Streptococcus caprae TaxID=1640501 RepID=A0ABV8CT16_9STRE
MWNKIQKKRRSEGNFSYFLHFFTVFSIIFLAMTIIVLNIMNSGAYSTVDQSLKVASDNANHYVMLGLSHEQFFSEVSITEKQIQSTEDKKETTEKSIAVKVKPPSDFSANMDVVVYDKDGNVLGTTDSFSGIEDISLSTKNLNDVYAIDDFETLSGRAESYRAVTVPVSHTDYPDAAYITIFVNTTQIQDANRRSERITITTMILFWLISIGASVYLAKWSRKPILANYERQKSFVENASHELRTPLAVLQNRLEALFRKPDATILDSSENIAASLEEVRNMRILTTNLLNLARRDDGMEVQLQELTGEFFEGLIENYELIAEDSSKEFYGQNLVKSVFKSDPVLLKQAITILFDNACKYTDDDGIIELTTRVVDKNLVITVADNGSGISDDDKDKIFDRFYRVDKARTRQKGGFGLGLSLAKQIVETLKGKLIVRDNFERGTIFEIKLPL